MPSRFELLVLQGATDEGTADGVLPTCVFWSELSNEWTVDGVVLESATLELDRTSTITCSTFHLSPFAVAEEEAPSGDWAAFGQLAGLSILQQVRRIAIEIVKTYHTTPDDIGPETIFTESDSWTVFEEGEKEKAWYQRVERTLEGLALFMSINYLCLLLCFVYDSTEQKAGRPSFS